MKILFIHNRYQNKGGEDTTLEMERSLLESKGHLTSLLEFNNVALHTLPSKLNAGLRSLYDPGSARRLKDEIRRFTPDVIHVHNLFYKASPSVLYQAARSRVPVVMTVQNYRFICANALLLRNDQVCELCVHKTFPLEGIKYKCYRSSSMESALVTGINGVHKLLHTWENKLDKIIVPSHFLKAKLAASSLGFPGDEIIVKPNFVHDIPVAHTQREDFFLFVGRLSKEKGIHTLLDCFVNRPDRRLVIAGDGPEKEPLLAAIRDIPSIDYIGLQPKDAIVTLMKKTRALIFPSIWYEGQPLTIIEALMTGTPVIASRLGAMAEMIIHGYNGLHFDHGDPKDLEKSITLFTGSDSLQQQLYAQARKSYEENYHPDIHYASILNIYDTVINRRDYYA